MNKKIIGLMMLSIFASSPTFASFVVKEGKGLGFLLSKNLGSRLLKNKKIKGAPKPGGDKKSLPQKETRGSSCPFEISPEDDLFSLKKPGDLPRSTSSKKEDSSSPTSE